MLSGEKGPAVDKRSVPRENTSRHTLPWQKVTLSTSEYGVFISQFILSEFSGVPDTTLLNKELIVLNLLLPVLLLLGSNVPLFYSIICYCWILYLLFVIPGM